MNLRHFCSKNFLKKSSVQFYHDGRHNNFNLIRMFAAVGVLISHAYALTGGRAAEQPLQAILKGVTLGTVCVMIFFGVSGYLVARSFERSETFSRFVAARTLRVLPALIFVLIVTVLFAGIFLTERPAEFWPEAPAYVFRNAMLYWPLYPLPGVFENNPWGPAINGSLWTLNHEASCYVGLSLLGMAGALTNRRYMALALAIFVVFYSAVIFFEPLMRLVKLMHLAMPFMIGSAVYVWREYVPLSVPIGLILAVSAAGLHQTPYFQPAFAVALIYGVFLAAYLPRGWVRSYNRFGDYSYGTYLYAFPVQQLLVALDGSMSPIENIILSLPLTLFCAVLSWNWIEKPSLLFLRNS